jgi:hypothetical protein
MKKVHVFVSIYQGLVDGVLVFADDKKAERYIKKAFGHQGRAYVAAIGNNDEKWNDYCDEYDGKDYEIHLYETEIIE